ncbi:MAG: hypothetical protein OXB95_08500 [Rhodobacteraceae bacterium]|nr:hypothetical protein [Paracoccaceae bacterium]
MTHACAIGNGGANAILAAAEHEHPSQCAVETGAGHPKAEPTAGKSEKATILAMLDCALVSAGVGNSLRQDRLIARMPAFDATAVGGGQGRPSDTLAKQHSSGHSSAMLYLGCRATTVTAVPMAALAIASRPCSPLMPHIAAVDGRFAQEFKRVREAATAFAAGFVRLLIGSFTCDPATLERMPTHEPCKPHKATGTGLAARNPACGDVGLAGLNWYGGTVARISKHAQTETKPRFRDIIELVGHSQDTNRAAKAGRRHGRKRHSQHIRKNP